MVFAMASVHMCAYKLLQHLAASLMGIKEDEARFV
jgi:hypothetical protein